MKNLVMLVLLAIAAYYGWRNFTQGGAQIVERDGAKLAVVKLDGGSAEYGLGDPAEETYMIFGASGQETSDSHGIMFGIPLKTAARLKARYPDFTRCDSAGAKDAQSSVQDIRVVAGKREHLAALKNVSEEFESRLRAKGERLCVTVRGQWLELAAVERGGTRLSYEELKAKLPAQALKGSYVLTDAIMLANCSDLI